MKSKLILILCLSVLSSQSLANYQAAQAYFARRDYINAATQFFQAKAYPKDKAEKQKAEWGLAESLHRLGLYYASSKYYSLIVRRGSNADNPFFRKALEELGHVNSTVSLGQSHVVELFKSKIDLAEVPGPARGFYFYYMGVEAYSNRKFEKAEGYFKRVPASSPYYVRALFHIGVISNLSGRHSKAKSYFERVLSSSEHYANIQELQEQANLNLARVNYETKDYLQALNYYQLIPRDSDNWLDSLWEAAWAFFHIQKHNNTLGLIHTIHSPFFENRFYPETYILQAISFLRLCRFEEVRAALRKFRARYSPTFKDIRAVLRKYEDNPKGFFRIIYDYRNGNFKSYRDAWEIIDKLSRTDSYKEAYDTIRFSDRELARLSTFGAKWKSNGLYDEIQSFLSSKKSAAIDDAGRRLYLKGASFYAYLKELSDQTGLIQAEMMLGKIDQLRKKLNVGTAQPRVHFAGGLQKLQLGVRYEYWPFETEYWEDELGYYQYNIDSKCKAFDQKDNTVNN